MKHIIRNKSIMSVLDKPIDSMPREPKGAMSFNREILRTYRQLWKVTHRYNWNNEDGHMWRDVLRTSARVEFEQVFQEVDPLEVGKFLITWRDAINRMHEKVNEVNMKMSCFVQETRVDQQPKAFDPFSDKRMY